MEYLKPRPNTCSDIQEKIGLEAMIRGTHWVKRQQGLLARDLRARSRI
jgi:hypothetical protein